MAKKKKAQLNPVARGFATTSQPSKRAIAEAQEAAAIAKSEATVVSTSEPTPDQTASLTPTGEPSALTEPKELDFEEQTWQDMVDRWQNKTDREIARNIQIIETERRLTKSLALPQVTLDSLWRRRALDLVAQEEEEKLKLLNESSNKVLPRLAIVYGILRRLGFQHVASIQCLQSVQNLDLDTALDWVYLHCDTDGLPYAGNPQSDFTFKPSTSMRCGITFTSRLTPAIPNPPISKLNQHPTSSSAKPLSQNTSHKVPSNPSNPPTPPALVYESDGETASTFGSDEELEPSILHARLRLRILTLRRSGRSETDPKVTALTMKQNEAAKDYMFEAKDAEREFLSLKVAMDEADLKARLRGESDATGSATGGKKRARKSTSKLPFGSPAPEEEEEEEETMFSTMLDEMPTTEVSSTGTTITVRNLPVPKHASFAKSPKTLLSETARKIDKYAVVSYEIIGGSSKAARVKCDVRWNGGRTSEWRMDGVGCWGRDQAEWFVSTVALHALAYPLPDEDDTGFAAGGGAQSGAMGISVSGVGNFPPPYRDLWSELEVERKGREAARNRKVWRFLSEISDARGAAGENNATPSAKKTATPPKETNHLPNSGTNLYSQTLQTEFTTRRASPAYQTMLQQRQTLPIAVHRDQILQILSSHQVLVLSGETGCGKSTQLPAFILEDQLSRGLPCKIFCTEPRRISAISLAQRVSAEQGESPNAVETSNGLVGYSVRLDSHIGPKTRLAYVTYGIALKMLENGSAGGQAGTAFDEVTHVIIDEVHERSIESDFLLIVLRSMIERRKDLKVILMSATVDSEKISKFFGGCPTLQVPGRTFPVDVRYLEDAVEFTGWKVDSISPYAKQQKGKNYRSGKLDWNEDLEVNSDEDVPAGEQVVKFEKRYSQQTISTINLFDERFIPYELIVRLLERICFEDCAYATYSAAVLVFMPGLNEIRKLTDLLVSHEQFGGDAFRLYPLHSTISTEDQGAVFNTLPTGMRKIVIATNIAETGITIPDITCVIDTGKHREMRFDEKRHLSRLVETYIARSNAAQRRGRAGRVREGLCFHLFTKSRHDTQLIDHPSPEMLRLSLSDLALRIMMMTIFNGLSVEDVLSKALDPPIVLNVQRAVASLVEVNALTPMEEITPMGRLLSKLPTDVHLGKFLLFASIFKCLDPALTIAAALTSKSPFITPFGHEAEATLAKASFRSEDSDFLTIHNAFASWRRAHANGQSAARTLCKKSFLSYQNLQQIEEIRQQYLSYLVDASFVLVDAVCQKELSRARFTSRQRVRFVSVPPDLNTNAQDSASWATNAALAAGLFPKLLIVEKGKMQTLGNSQPVGFHPSSVNFRKRPEDIVGGGTCLMYFTLMHSKKLYVWETSPVNDHALLLLCGDVEFKPAVGQIIVDRKLKFQVDSKTALAFKALRTHLASALHVRLRGKAPNMKLDEWVRLTFDILSYKAAA